VGLDIGAITPEEIAVSITAELIASRRKVERQLPHMSWFHRRSQQTGGDAVTNESAVKLDQDI